MRYHNFRINIWLQIRNSSVHTVFKRELVTWMCVIFWNLSKHQIPCKQIQPTLFYLNILLFYFIEIILLNSQIEFDLRRTFCPVVCFCFCFCFGYFFCPFFSTEDCILKFILCIACLGMTLIQDFSHTEFLCTERFDLWPFTEDFEKSGCWHCKSFLT